MLKSSGPGGQNVNKNSTAIELEFDVLKSNLFTKKIKSKIISSSNKYLTNKGKIIIRANKYKSQKRNKSEAIDRLVNYLNYFLINKKKGFSLRQQNHLLKKD